MAHIECSHNPIFHRKIPMDGERNRLLPNAVVRSCDKDHIFSKMSCQTQGRESALSNVENGMR